MHTRTEKKRVLIVEDDRELAQWILQYLQKHDFECMHCEDGLNGEELSQSFAPDAVILDGMLPGLDGLDVCKAIRKYSNVPVLMLTARDEEVDEVLGLEAGANDYLIKPVRLRALLTRINKLIDEWNATGDGFSNTHTSQIKIGELLVDTACRTAFLKEEVIELTSKEFDVLLYLAERVGTVVKRVDMIKALRGLEFDGFDRTIDLNVSRLRKKLNDKFDSAITIKTVWGKGYMLARS